MKFIRKFFGQQNSCEQSETMMNVKDNPLAKQFETERWYCMCCVKCLCTVFAIAVLMIVVGGLLAFLNSTSSETKKTGAILLAIGILVAVVVLLSLFCLVRTVMRYERRINNPEPFVAPKDGYPKQQYQ